MRNWSFFCLFRLRFTYYMFFILPRSDTNSPHSMDSAALPSMSCHYGEPVYKSLLSGQLFAFTLICPTLHFCSQRQIKVLPAIHPKPISRLLTSTILSPVKLNWIDSLIRTEKRGKSYLFPKTCWTCFRWSLPFPWGIVRSDDDE